MISPWNKNSYKDHDEESDIFLSKFYNEFSIHMYFVRPQQFEHGVAMYKFFRFVLYDYFE